MSKKAFTSRIKRVNLYHKACKIQRNCTPFHVLECLCAREAIVLMTYLLDVSGTPHHGRLESTDQD